MCDLKTPNKSKKKEGKMNCSCGSEKSKYANYDGYGIFLTYVCEDCEKEKMNEFRSDINERYETDEQIEEEQ